MNTLNKDEIIRALEEIRNISSKNTPSIQDNIRINQLTRQVNESIPSLPEEDLSDVNSFIDSQKNIGIDEDYTDNGLNESIKIEHIPKNQNNKDSQLVQVNKDPNSMSQSAKDQLNDLKRKREAIENELKIEKEKDQLSKLSKELDSIKKESDYVMSKPDEEGLITLNEAKYQEKMKKLSLDLEAATTFMEKQKIKTQIGKLQSARMRVKLNNGVVKVSKHSKKLSKWMNEISGAFGEMGKLGSLGELEQKKEESSKQQKKKGKKNNQEDQEEQKKKAKTKDYGFNMENVFDNKADGFF